VTHAPWPAESFDWWWLSFVDTDMPYTKEGDYPGGPRWQGACIVPGPTFMDAVSHAWRLGCNPGGQVSGFPCPPGHTPPEKYQGRLLTREDVDEMDAEEAAEND
jgi:hypothetical protein